MAKATVREHVNERAWKVLEKAEQHCQKLLRKITKICNQFLKENKLPVEEVCFVIVGSIGRREALQASDIDFIPVLQSSATLEQFQSHDQNLRQQLRDKMNLKVSQGEDLTKCASVAELTDPESIGGTTDDSSTLTKRILILTEGTQAGGKLPLKTIRHEVLRAYAGYERTRGRHVLSLCNDLARYYRTLCIEYKAKADDPAKDWCTRNMKLRHSRKFWYLSAIMTIVHLANDNPQGDQPYIDGLLDALDRPPCVRFFEAVHESQRGLVGQIVDPFTWFLDFMSDASRREKLQEVQHENRYDMDMNNPFHAVKLNSDRMHQAMLSLIDSLPTHQRQRILSWFLL